MDDWFRRLFKVEPPAPARDKFLARLFGLFSEDIVRIWCEAPWSPYRDLGRPRVFSSRSGKGHTLDFTLQSRKDGLTYVSEMKCWVEYQNYRYLTLRNADQLGAMEGPAFNAFLSVACSPSSCKVSVNGSPQQISGAILIWGDVDDSGRIDVKRSHKIADVLSLQDIIDELVSKEHQPYLNFLEERLRWCQHLFQGLAKN
jgi:hypothetical protein